MAVIERFGGCCHGCRGCAEVVRGNGKSGNKTVTELLSLLLKALPEC
ncbi:MAG: hypothetical protein K6E50_00195 [Lachnospiraceae bacterium]|nr:hypothetical protein [Lachnospiraceae bacterium]